MGKKLAGKALRVKEFFWWVMGIFGGFW